MSQKPRWNLGKYGGKISLLASENKTIQNMQNVLQKECFKYSKELEQEILTCTI